MNEILNKDIPDVIEGIGFGYSPKFHDALLRAGICIRLLLECKDIPILGVCLGHQVFYLCTYC